LNLDTLEEETLEGFVQKEYNSIEKMCFEGEKNEQFMQIYFKVVSEDR
jgi:hypothetical protein